MQKSSLRELLILSGACALLAACDGESGSTTPADDSAAESTGFVEETPATGDDVTEEVVVEESVEDPLPEGQSIMAGATVDDWKLKDSTLTETPEGLSLTIQPGGLARFQKAKIAVEAGDSYYFSSVVTPATDGEIFIQLKSACDDTEAETIGKRFDLAMGTTRTLSLALDYEAAHGCNMLTLKSGETPISVLLTETVLIKS